MKNFFHNVIKNDSENLLRKTNVIWHWHQCHKCTQEIWLWHNVILPSFWLVQVFKNEFFILWRDSIEYEQTQLWRRRQRILYHKRGLKEHSQMLIRRQLWRDFVKTPFLYCNIKKLEEVNFHANNKGVWRAISNRDHPTTIVVSHVLSSHRFSHSIVLTSNQ